MISINLSTKIKTNVGISLTIPSSMELGTRSWTRDQGVNFSTTNNSNEQAECVADIVNHLSSDINDRTNLIVLAVSKDNYHHIKVSLEKKGIIVYSSLDYINKCFIAERGSIFYEFLNELSWFAQFRKDCRESGALTNQMRSELFLKLCRIFSIHSNDDRDIIEDTIIHEERYVALKHDDYLYKEIPLMRNAYKNILSCILVENTADVFVEIAYVVLSCFSARMTQQDQNYIREALNHMAITTEEYSNNELYKAFKPQVVLIEHNDLNREFTEKFKRVIVADLQPTISFHSGAGENLCYSESTRSFDYECSEIYLIFRLDLLKAPLLSQDEVVIAE